MAERLATGKGAFLQAAQSAAPLVLALVLKIVLWDYLVALKSFSIWHHLLVPLGSASSIQKRRTAIFIKFGGVLFDLFVTAWATAALLNWLDLVRVARSSSAVAKTPNFASVLGEMIDSIN